MAEREERVGIDQVMTQHNSRGAYADDGFDDVDDMITICFDAK